MKEIIINFSSGETLKRVDNLPCVFVKSFAIEEEKSRIVVAEKDVRSTDLYLFCSSNSSYTRVQNNAVINPPRKAMVILGHRTEKREIIAVSKRDVTLELTLDTGQMSHDSNGMAYMKKYTFNATFKVSDCLIFLQNRIEITGHLSNAYLLALIKGSYQKVNGSRILNNRAIRDALTTSLKRFGLVCCFIHVHEGLSQEARQVALLNNKHHLREISAKGDIEIECLKRDSSRNHLYQDGLMQLDLKRQADIDKKGVDLNYRSHRMKELVEALRSANLPVTPELIAIAAMFPEELQKIQPVLKKFGKRQKKNRHTKNRYFPL